MGTAAAEAFGDMLPLNKTLRTLDVSNNSFGKMQVGDPVKLKSSGEMKVLISDIEYGDEIKFDGSRGHPEADTYGFVKLSKLEWESQVPALCAGIAASQTLTAVSDFLTCTIDSCFFFLTPDPFFASSYVAQLFVQRP
jgi:hypothetical protein